MRILRSTHSVNPAIGGPIESIKQSSAALTARGHAVEVVSLDTPSDPWVHECPIRVHALGPGRGRYGYASAFPRWIAERRAQHDTVIVHGLWQYSSFGVWRALRGSETPYFVFPHGMLDPWFNRTYPLKHFKKMLYWPWGEYRVLRDAAAVLFTSREERERARESFSPYRANEVVVNYGTAGPEIDWAVAQEEFWDRFPQLRAQRFLLFLGRLHEKKGCDLLIKAFEKLAERSFHLVIAGPCADNSYLAHLRRLAGTFPITFAGMLSGNMKWGALRAADAFILPSHQENFGIAVVEALACGTPVLISNKVNIWREVVKDGGGIAEEDNLAGTVRLLERWITIAPAARDEMSAKARESFARRFDINRAADSLLEVLQTARPAA